MGREDPRVHRLDQTRPGPSVRVRFPGALCFASGLQVQYKGLWRERVASSVFIGSAIIRDRLNPCLMCAVINEHFVFISGPTR